MGRGLLPGLRRVIAAIEQNRPIGRVRDISGSVVRVTGLAGEARLGDRVQILRLPDALAGEVIEISPGGVAVLTEGQPIGLRAGAVVRLLGRSDIRPGASWLGRVVDPFGRPLDGRPLSHGAVARAVVAPAPDAATRRRLGGRLETGMAAFNTFLPIVRGQRIGLFAGSGVGKSSLLASLARGVEADAVVIALVGERGRELREFTEDVLDDRMRRRAVIVAATSDQPAVVRRRCAWTAMALAEHFRDAGDHVLLIVDSVTRFAEAHREVALAAGEPASLRGYPPSTAYQIMALAERAGPGPEGGPESGGATGPAGDITAVFSVLVAGSDMEETVADTLRGTLDGHVVLDRAIAERGRYPAIDLLRSVSRSLPGAADAEENALLLRARRLLGAYERAELMIRAGLYAAGTDPDVDTAIRLWARLDAFIAESGGGSIGGDHARLAAILGG